MRTIEVTVMKTVVFITGLESCYMETIQRNGRNVSMYSSRSYHPDKGCDILEFLTTLFGQRQIGAFSNYEVKIKGNGQ